MTNDNRLGVKITTLRESLRLSQAELAERCDCEVKVIEGLEEGNLAPSLAPLIKITRALGVRLGTLLDDDTNVGPAVTRKGDIEEATRLKSLETSSDAGLLQFFSLADGKSARQMETFIINADPSGELDHVLSTHEGEEFLYALDGSLEIAYGKDIYVIEPGDSIYYDSIVPHQVRAHGSDSARFLAVVYTPV
ncbi:MAG: XRE family transcriptional regulator [Actinobacteria bacterium]|nr:XRE family transcriptional regulator [Actinomycetota bacterium]